MNEQSKIKSKTAFDLTAAKAALADGNPIAFRGIALHSCVIDGRRFNFAVDRVRDPIQRNHRQGRFYETPELDEIKAIFPKGGVFVDIGANVGNHSLFVAGFLSPSRVIPFEPNPVAYKLLLANIVLNDFADVFDARHLGVGVSDKAAGGFAMEDRTRNLGAAKMQPGQGDIDVVRGDDVLADVTPDLIKIDVEGMEIGVLNGLRSTIDRAKPALMIEVDGENDEAFHALVEDMGYGVAKKMGQYKTNSNYIIRSLDQI